VKYSLSVRPGNRSVVKRLQFDHYHYGRYIIATECAPKLGAYDKSIPASTFSIIQLSNSLEWFYHDYEELVKTNNIESAFIMSFNAPFADIGRSV
jgi:hypothetical protein